MYDEENSVHRQEVVWAKKFEKSAIQLTYMDKKSCQLSSEFIFSTNNSDITCFFKFQLIFLASFLQQSLKFPLHNH